MNAKNEFDIVIVANSPGELSALARPIAQKLKYKLPDTRIILFLTPCQYSSGNEVEFARKNLKVDHIVTAEEYKKWLLGAQLPNKLIMKNQGIVIFVGGDLLYATLIAKKLGYKAYAYLAGNHVSWVSFFKKFFVPEKHIFAGKIPELKMEEVGDLMSEPLPVMQKADVIDKWHLDPKKLTIAMMPGSRKWEIDHLVPIYKNIVRTIKKERSDIQFILIVSPFTALKDLEEKDPDHDFDVFAPFDSISAADLVITIPGTNTAQIGALAIPMFVIFPLDKPESIPLEGLAHYITSIPVLGLIIKKAIINVVSKKTKFFALPNIKANHEIVPEIRGNIDINWTAYAIQKLIDDKAGLQKIREDLKFVMKPRNTSDRIVEIILNENTF